MGVKRALQHLSRSIAYTRKSLKKQSCCYAIILTSRSQAKLFDGISDGKSFPAIPAPGNTVNRSVRQRKTLQIKASPALRIAGLRDLSRSLPSALTED